MERREGYRYTALGWIPEMWEVKKIGSICDSIVPGRNKPKSFNGNIPWITTPDIEHSGTVLTSKQNLFISKEEAKTIGSKIVKKGSIIISCVGELGIVAFAGTDMIINQQLHAFLPNENVCSKFLLYALAQQQEYMLKVATTTAVPYMNKDNCNSIPIPLPPLPEQRKIAAALCTWDMAITGESALITALQSRHRALMQRLLSGRVRLKGFAGEWKEVRLGDVFDFIKSYSVSREGLTREATNEGIYCIHYGDIHALYENEFLDFSVQTRIPQLSGDTITDEDDFLKEGDIIMADASEDYEGVGEAIEVINLEGRNAVGGLHTIVLRDKAEQTKRRYRAYLFSSENVRNQLRKLATGTSVYSVTKSTLQKVGLHLPPLEEQIAIAQILTTSEREIAAHKAHLIALQSQKKGLMQVLLTGKKRVKL